MDDFLELLRDAEVALHEPSTRHAPSKLDALLHERFLEFGRSGISFDRAEILARLALDESDRRILSQDFAVTPLGASAALLTYRSASVDDSGRVIKHTLRASIWMHTPDGWKLRFHQGTPTEPFAIVSCDH